jgi:hypothetical protein
VPTDARNATIWYDREVLGVDQDDTNLNPYEEETLCPDMSSSETSPLLAQQSARRCVMQHTNPILSSLR